MTVPISMATDTTSDQNNRGSAEYEARWLVDCGNSTRPITSIESGEKANRERNEQKQSSFKGDGLLLTWVVLRVG